jgi:UDP-N-acetylglucosamine/UDP-N-acetylgalactosamine diphosphorylase
MTTVPDDLRDRLREQGQEHVLAGWDQLEEKQRSDLLAQLAALDLDHLRQLFDNREQGFPVPRLDRIEPVPVIGPEAATAEVRRVGEEALRRGEVAVLVVAGGQGSRLGFEHPKGLFPVGPVSGKSLFQIHAEKVLARSRRYGSNLPFLVMTSDATDAETRTFFEEQHHFGLPPEEVFFFRQGTMPALDLETGKLLLEAPGRLFTSPNGHGGTLTALADSGLLEQMKQRGIRQIFYFQVDNPLVKVTDPIFLGHHLQADAEASSKIIPKEGPKDKLGNLVQIDGRCTIIEYSDLPDDVAQETDEHGQLRLRAGSPAIHLFSVEFLDRMTAGRGRMPFHIARKKVPHIDASGQRVEPEKENALKFEMFIFDVLPLAERWTVVETSRREEFEPLKNATGSDSPESVQQALTRLAGDWLARAGATFPRYANDEPLFPLEINPLFALDAEELAARLPPDLQIPAATYLTNE